MTIPADWNWRAPDYATVFQERARRLALIRSKPEMLPGLKRFYRDNPAQFITDWGCTADPRNVEIGLPAVVPFLLFPKQVEWVEWVLRQWRAREPGVTPKSRESGISWLAIALSCTLCNFNPHMTIGFGSRHLYLVDTLGDPDSLFWKAREFMALLPPEFTGGWTRDHAPEKRIKFPATGSVMKGEGGDDIGRGGRSSIYFVDEAAFLQHPDLAEASLSATTNCRMDISTPNGQGNPFHRKVTRWPAHRVFRFHWRDDPRKDDAWYAKQIDELDPVTVAQEVDIDFAASVEGVLIPSAWVEASVDAHLRMGWAVSGDRRGALDVADEGKDMNAFAAAHGPLVHYVEQWSGKGDDIFGTVERAFRLADDHGLRGFQYDADGLGAGVRGDARVINERRREQGAKVGSIMRPLDVTPFRGSGSVERPDAKDVPGRTNDDFFKNLKAQSWWALRRRFQETFRATQGKEYDPELVISLSSGLNNLADLKAELSQPTFSLNPQGKVVVDKAPDGTRSPNLADAVMILMGRYRRAMRISSEAMRAA